MKVHFDISETILEWSERDMEVAPTGESSLISGPAVTERRKILQRGLTLHDAASDLLSYVKRNGRQLRGSFGTQTSSDTFSVSPTEADEVIDNVDSLSGISTGSFTINGVLLQVDTSTDTFNELISRINSANTGVTATYNFSTEELTVNSLRSDMVRLEDGSAAFFEATNLEDGIFSGDTAVKYNEFLTSSTFQTKLSRFTNQFNKLLKLDFTEAYSLDYKKEIISNDRINLEYTSEENYKEELQRQTLENINKHIDSGFAHGALRLASAVEIVLTENLLYFSQSQVSFNSNDAPADLFNFLENDNGFLSQTLITSKRHNTALQRQISDNGTTGLMVGKTI